MVLHTGSPGSVCSGHLPRVPGIWPWEQHRLSHAQATGDTVLLSGVLLMTHGAHWSGDTRPPQGAVGPSDTSACSKPHILTGLPRPQPRHSPCPPPHMVPAEPSATHCFCHVYHRRSPLYVFIYRTKGLETMPSTAQGEAGEVAGQGKHPPAGGPRQRQLASCASTPRKENGERTGGLGEGGMTLDGPTPTPSRHSWHRLPEQQLHRDPRHCAEAGSSTATTFSRHGRTQEQR